MFDYVVTVAHGTNRFVLTTPAPAKDTLSILREYQETTENTGYSPDGMIFQACQMIPGEGLQPVNTELLQKTLENPTY